MFRLILAVSVAVLSLVVFPSAGQAACPIGGCGGGDDTSPPTTTIDTEITITSDNTPTWSFSADETVDEQWCAVAVASSAPVYAACSSTFTSAVLADGSYTFSVYSVDPAGNVGDADTDEFTVDRTGPSVFLLSSVVSVNHVTINFASSEGGASFTCELDGVPLAGCSPGMGISFANLSDGAHTFTVRAIDALGNVGPTNGLPFNVDTTGPALTFTSAPGEGSTIAINGASFSFTAEAGATFKCKLDDAALAACTSPMVLTNLGDGAHAFTVQATDTLGNVGPPNIRNFTVAVPPPPLPPAAGLAAPVPPAASNAGQKTGPCIGKTGRSLRRCLAVQRCKSKFKGKLSTKKRKARAKCLAKARRKK